MQTRGMNLSTKTQFERDTEVTLIEEGLYEANLSRDWWIVRGPNGGYIAAILQRALSAHVNDDGRRPRSLTVHYVSPPVEGEAQIAVKMERRGRTLTSLSIRMTQGPHVRALGLAALASPRKIDGFDHMTMPEVPPPGSLSHMDLSPPVHQRYEHRFITDFEPAPGRPGARVAAWLRLAEPQRLDPFLLAAYADALPPSTFGISPATDEFQVGPVPTVDLTVHFRADPAKLDIAPDAFCLAVCRSRLARDGFVEEDGEIWSPCGILLAHSRQLAVTLGR